MRLKDSILCAGLGLPLLLAASSSRAQVTMSIFNPNNGNPGDSFCAYQNISATLNNGALIQDNSDWIGIYSFDITASNPQITQNPFYSVCLSPEGVLNPGSYTYNLESFAQASPGINPSQWVPGGIQNANYLFSTFSSTIIGGGVAGLKGSTAQQGAALALAMYAALYNSSGYANGTGGTLLNGTAFANTSTDSSVDYDYGYFLTALKATTATVVNADAQSGDVLVPTIPTSQELILLGTDLPQGIGVVPEPTTLIAAALLLLPFAASTYRIARRNVRV